MIWRVLVLCLCASTAHAADCYDHTSNGIDYTICAASADDDLRLFHKRDTGEAFGQFYALSNYLSNQGKELVFAMNAGMFHADLSPVGHYVEQGRETMRVISTEGPGNFGMLPNGVFCIAKNRYRIYETSRYVAENPACEYATQSGPMLLIEGKFHPRFIKNSASLNIRNGVAVVDDMAYFVISNDRVNFYDFAKFFQDHLGAKDALYLDGKVSRLYAPALGRSDFGWSIGPMVGVVADR